MHWFLDPVTNQYADFSGRTARKSFWMYILLYVILYILVGAVGAFIGLEELALLFSLVLFVPGIAITARRLHDIGRSGWWQLIGLVPILGAIVMIVFLIRDSEPGDNQYGPNPKGVSGEGAAEGGMPTEGAAAPDMNPAPAEQNTGEMQQ